MPLKRAFLALGSNLGDRLSHLKQAIFLLESYNALIVTSASQIYENRAVGIEGGHDFYNAVIEVYTSLSPEVLLDACQKVESEMGRQRADVWLNRTVDIDLLYIDGVSINSERLVIPHPEILTRDFVLKPFSELNSDIKIQGKSICEHLKGIDLSAMSRVDSILYPSAQINQIVAVDQNHVIGVNGQLPWSIPEDWTIFLGKTKKGLLLMGRTSFLEMIKEPDWDKDRDYIVITASEPFMSHESVSFVNSVEEAMHRAKLSGKTVWICGGASIYASTFSDTDALYLTRIHGSFAGDTYFPEFKEFLPKLVSQIDSSNEQLSYTFEIWSR